MEGKHSISVLGVDLGGTNVSVGSVTDNSVVKRSKIVLPPNGEEEVVLQTLYSAIDSVFTDDIVGIGIGVPSVVDIEKGIVYDVQNIPSWKKVPLKTLLESRYNRPVFINNDANCFAIGEKHFGQGQVYSNMIGLIVGTGLAAGVIINDRLYNGRNCGAGEFGMLPYLDQHVEYYCSGQFFQRCHNIAGETLFNKAQNGDQNAISIFNEFGSHIGTAIKMVLYAYDPEAIILGGSVSQAYPFFKEALWARIDELAFRPVAENIKIEVSTQSDIAILGAAALYFDGLIASQTKAY